MLRSLLIGKLHRATVTAVRMDYEGSIAIDPDLLDAAGILVAERVLIADVENGQRFETYVILAPRGSREVMVNGAAARLVQVGDHLIICAFGLIPNGEAGQHRPRVVLMGTGNVIYTGA